MRGLVNGSRILEAGHPIPWIYPVDPRAFSSADRLINGSVGPRYLFDLLLVINCAEDRAASTANDQNYTHTGPRTFRSGDFLATTMRTFRLHLPPPRNQNLIILYALLHGIPQQYKSHWTGAGASICVVALGTPKASIASQSRSRLEDRASSCHAISSK